jgi:ribonucleotide reductase beta subunit family protein with ferritin-like domain
MERIVAFACIEGVIFSGAFCAIYDLKRRKTTDGKTSLAGLCTANEFIARDEKVHTMFAVEVFKTLAHQQTKPTVNVIHAIVKECIDVSDKFLSEALQVELIGMSANKMRAYIQNTADHLCMLLEYPKIYNVPNPFEWMAKIGLQNTTSFFENRVTSYSKPQNTKDDYDTSIEF